ncbi:neurocan core protein-like [Stylophora pistillata]|uniref:neurocan core protein-like n=1 Tax=Stylophora pistillata TaxID=50429 RepID=UPI000C03D145|nr:neurocan core protein-like [Stylophora pistillata]
MEFHYTVHVLLLSSMFCLYAGNYTAALSFNGKDPCDSGWLNYQTICIKYFPESNTWSKARQTCRGYDADLLTIHDGIKQKFVYNNFAQGKTLWIGLLRNEDDVFRWVDGTELKFANWVTNAPNNVNEKCGEMTSYGSFYGRWNDKSCSQPQPFICQKEAKHNNIFRRFPGKQLLGYVISRSRVRSDVECVLRCQRHPACTSINYIRSNSGLEEQRTKTCELNQQVNGVLSEILHIQEQSCYFMVV